MYFFFYKNHVIEKAFLFFLIYLKKILHFFYHLKNICFSKYLYFIRKKHNNQLFLFDLEMENQWEFDKFHEDSYGINSIYFKIKSQQII